MPEIWLVRVTSKMASDVKSTVELYQIDHYQYDADVFAKCPDAQGPHHDMGEVLHRRMEAESVIVTVFLI